MVHLPGLQARIVIQGNVLLSLDKFVRHWDQNLVYVAENRHLARTLLEFRFIVLTLSRRRKFQFLYLCRRPLRVRLS